METQEIQNSQSNPEQKEQCWGYQNTWLQIILQSNSNTNSMVLQQNQTHMEENKKSRNKPKYPEPRKTILVYNKYMLIFF
jgi:hypothetical protein